MFLSCWILNQFHKIPRFRSFFNGLGSVFNTFGLNIQRWKMTCGSIFNPGQNSSLHGLKHGFKLQCFGPRISGFTKNLCSASDNWNILLEKIRSEVMAGPMVGLYYSPPPPQPCLINMYLPSAFFPKVMDDGVW